MSDAARNLVEKDEQQPVVATFRFATRRWLSEN